MVHHSSGELHHSPVLFCTIRQHSSAPFVSTAAQFVSTVLHHSSAQFCTIHQYSCTIHQYCSTPFISYNSAPFVNSVLHHSLATILHNSLATILRHLLMLFYKSASLNNLAMDANTPQLFNGIVEIMVLVTAAYRTFCPTCQCIYSTVEIQLHYTSVKSMFFCPAAELLVNSVFYRHLIVTLRSMPFILRISALSCLHFSIC